jgi:hypothetical protein
MDSVVREWVQDKLRDEVGAIADDPHGYCGGDISPVAAWRRIEHIAQELDLDPVAILTRDRTPFEIERLAKLTGRDFG